jgi:cytochrome c biogenesis protein CcmG, thiol:disulfide interchange protein DsbE
MQRNKLVFGLLLAFFALVHMSHAQNHAPIPAGQAVWHPDTIYPYSMQLFTPDSVGAVASRVMPKLDKPIVLSFWLTTCYPCRMELEAYTKNYAQWKKEANFEIVAISIDFPQRFAQIGKIAREIGYPFPVFWDVNREFTQIMPGGLNGLPQVFVLDKNGKIAYHHRRYMPGDELKVFEVVKGLQ